MAKYFISGKNVCSKFTCSICGLERTIPFDVANSNICRKCLMSVRYKNVPYYYKTCSICNRTYFNKGNTSNAHYCIQCYRRKIVNSYNHSKVLKRISSAVYCSDLLTGELFLAMEEPNTILIKFKNDIVYHIGEKKFDKKTVLKSYNLYKYKISDYSIHDIAYNTLKFKENAKKWKINL